MPPASGTPACCLVTQGRAKEAIEVMEEMHKRAPSLRTDLMLAFLLFDQGRLERAEELVRDLTAKHGKEPECQLALAAFCLRRSADGKQLEQAREHLARAEKALPSDAAAPAPEEMGAEEQDAPAAPGKGRIEFNRRDPNYWRSQHRFLKAIYMGLTDQPLKAWVELRTLRTENPQDQHVEAALRAFE
ncbi:MAG: tetratricopeptide repeat protein [Gemmataceae bacterium]